MSSPQREHAAEAAAEAAAEQAQSVAKARRLPWLLSMTVACGLGLFVTTLVLSSQRAPAVQASDLPADLTDRFERAAPDYDAKVKTAEAVTGLRRLRRRLLAQARGHVLEVAVGTGRNTPFYDTKRCDTVTLVDSSRAMLAVARRKWEAAHPDYYHRVFFKRGDCCAATAAAPSSDAVDSADAADAGVLTPPFGAQAGFDTVVDTMGLCSTRDPVQLLHNLEAVTEPTAGRILLLEHGRAHYGWLNALLDRHAAAHADAHGCWWNRDIGAIVAASGLRVDRIRRYSLGTVWWVELRPRHGVRARATAADSNPPPAERQTWTAWATAWAAWARGAS